MVTLPFVTFLMLNPTVGIMSSLNWPDWRKKKREIAEMYSWNCFHYFTLNSFVFWWFWRPIDFPVAVSVGLQSLVFKGLPSETIFWSMIHSESLNKNQARKFLRGILPYIVLIYPNSSHYLHTFLKFFQTTHSISKLNLSSHLAIYLLYYKSRY